MRNESLNIEELVEGVAKGSKKDFEILFHFYFPRLEKYAHSILKDGYSAEDLVQEVFVQIWNQRKNLNKEKKLSSFLFTLVKNRCLNVLKKKIIEDKYVSAQINFDTEELYHHSFAIEEGFTSAQEKLTVELEKVIQKMPERCQVAFRLKWFEGKKIREIAESMEISTTMVDKHLATGLKIARENMSPEMFLFFLIAYRKQF